MSLLKFGWSLLIVLGLVGANVAALWTVGQYPAPSASGPPLETNIALPPAIGQKAPGAEQGPPPPIKAPEPKQVTPAPTEPPNYRSLLVRGRAHLRHERYALAIVDFKQALEVWPAGEDARAGLERATQGQTARKVEQFEEMLKDGKALLHEGKTLRQEKKVRESLTVLDAALKLEPDNARAKRLLDDAKQTLADLLDPPLEGKVFVLVLYTNTKKSKVGTAGFDKQLADLSTKHEKNLLDGSAHVLTTKGVRKWSPGLKLPEKEAFDNEKVGPLFAAAFEAIAKTTARARNKDFKTVFVWETDFDPTGARNPMLTVPGRELRLCYRFTDRDNDMREPANLPWFGLSEDKVKRITDVEQLKTFVEDLGALDNL